MIKEYEALSLLKQKGWRQVRGRWNNDNLSENANGLSLNELLILEGIK